MSRFRSADWALLLTLLPFWAVCFGLHVHTMLSNGYAQPIMYVHSWTPDDYPTVEGFWAEFRGTPDLQVGDRVLRVGDVDLKGVNPWEFVLSVFEQAGDTLEAPIQFSRLLGSRLSGWSVV